MPTNFPNSSEKNCSLQVICGHNHGQPSRVARGARTEELRQLLGHLLLHQVTTEVQAGPPPAAPRARIEPLQHLVQSHPAQLGRLLQHIARLVADTQRLLEKGPL